MVLILAIRSRGFRQTYYPNQGFQNLTNHPPQNRQDLHQAEVESTPEFQTYPPSIQDFGYLVPGGGTSPDP